MNNIRPNNIVHSISEEIAINELKNILRVKSIALAEDTSDYITLENYNDTDSKEEQSSFLRNIISLLNEITQILYNTLDKNPDASTPEDTDEESYTKQLQNYNTQFYDLLSNFDRSLLPAFYEQTYYITNLSEIHYNTKFGLIKESYDNISSNTEDKSIKIGEVFKKLPEIKTNNLA
jgi:hypothetical protein